MLRLGIFFTNLLPIVGVAAVLTVPLIVASIVFAATNNPASVEFHTVVAPTNSGNVLPVERSQRRLPERLLPITTSHRLPAAVGREQLTGRALLASS
jgi:hypothetical protein